MARLREAKQQKEFIARFQKLSREAKAWITPVEAARLSEMVEKADLDKTPLNEQEKALLASSGAFLIMCVLDEEIDKLALLVRAIYTTGVQRGREEAKS